MTRLEPHRPAVAVRALAIAAVGFGGAVLGAGLYVAAARAGLRPWRYPGLSPLVTGSYALVGVLIAAVAWRLVRRRARRPRVVLGLTAGAVVVVTLGADLVAGATGRWAVGLASAGLHVVVIAAALAVLWWAMPLPPDDDARAVPPGPFAGWRTPARLGLAAVLVVAAVVWVLVNKAVEGPTLLVLSQRHGLTAADLLSVAALVTAGQLLRPARDEA